jgi:ABC-2 type transport system permease protein
MSITRILFKRELASYFLTPVAYVFIVIFLLLAGVFTFFFGNLYQSNQADLRGFFFWHPFLYLFLIPAVSMRLWSEERKSGTIELLLTLPVTMWQGVMAKFLAAWVFVCVALALTFPVWITVNYLGDPDNGAILTGYVGSALMAGAFLAIGSCFSALTRNQVIAFVVTVVVCLAFVLVGFLAPVLAGHLWQPLVDALASMSVWTHFEAVQKGVIDLRDLIYFGLMIGFWLYASAVVIDYKKAD